MRYNKHLLVSEFKTPTSLTTSMLYTGKYPTRIDSKLKFKALKRGTLASLLWNQQSLDLLKKDKYTSDLPIVYKIERTSAYKASLKPLIESLERFPENTKIIEQLRSNLKQIPDYKAKEDVLLEGTLFHDLYKTLRKKIDESVYFRERHLVGFKKAENALPSKLDSAKKESAKSKLKKYHLNLLVDKSDINFLKKEFAFTKLKYSCCPQYDSVSGGFAALFAGFIGFLISEKFGIELVDSGDFYIALIYGIFMGFIAHLLTRLIWTGSSYSLPISLNHNKSFVYEFARFLLKKITIR